MPCNADAAIKEIVRREIVAQQQAMMQHMDRKIKQWNSQHAPKQVGAQILASASQAVIDEAIRQAQGLIEAFVPRLSAEQVAAAREAQLAEGAAILSWLGVPQAEIAEAVEAERCVWHVLDQLVSGELAAGAVQAAMES